LHLIILVVHVTLKVPSFLSGTAASATLGTTTSIGLFAFANLLFKGGLVRGTPL